MNRNWRYLRAGVLIAFLLFSTFSTLSIISDEALGQTTIATLKWNPGQEIQEADVRPGGDNNVMFTCVANCDLVAGGTYQRVVLNLYATSENDWPISIDPIQIEYRPETDTDIPFSVIVTVPAKTSYYTTDTIMVYGNATAYPGGVSEEINPIVGSIRMRQYFDLIVETGFNRESLRMGDETKFNITITNTGNARDDFQINIKNSKELEDAGIEIDLDRSRIEIDSNEKGTIQVTIKTSKDSKAGTYDINLETKSVLEELIEGLTIPYEISPTIKVEEGKSEGKSEDNSLLMVVIPLIIIIIVIIVIVVIWVISNASKKRDQNKSPDQPVDDFTRPSTTPPDRPIQYPSSPPMGPAQTCRVCNAQLRFIAEHQQWYCDRCQKYR